MVKLEDRLKHIVPKSVVLLEVPASENPMRMVADFLRFRQNDKGIYISSNRSTRNLVEQLDAKGFDLRTHLETERIYVIDLVSKSVCASEAKGSINVASPSDLSATQMAVEKAADRLSGIGGNPWLLLDSLSTLLVFNGSGALLHFLHFLVSRLRVLGYDGAMFTVEGSLDLSVLLTIRQFCDEVIKL